MRHFLLSALLCMAFLLPAALGAKEPLNTSGVDALVKSYGSLDEPGISVAISNGGELIYEGWSGLADLERGVPIGENTRFHIASISKQFTAFAILKLAEEGKLSIDQPVSDFFPEMAASKGMLTIRHLLDHTGGLREVNTLAQMLGMQESSPVTAEQSLALILRQRAANFEPGQGEEYSNTGYQLLAHIVAQVSGQNFADYMQTQVFAPLGMAQSFVRTDPLALIENGADSYERRGENFAHSPILSTSFGSTGIVSSPRDLLRWGYALNAAEIAGEPIMRAMAQRFQLPDGRETVAANGQEFREFRGVKTWSHGGTTAGYRSFLLRLPDQGIVIAVMGNRGDFLKAAFAFDLAATLLEGALEPTPEPDMGAETIAQLDSYAGDYELFPGTIFSLRRDGDTLTFANYGSADAFPLPRISKGEFMLVPTRDLRLVFKDFVDGQATQMRWKVSADGYLRAKRVTMEPLSETPIEPSFYTGTYYSDELQIGFDIVQKEGALWLASSLSDPVPLIQYQPGVFRPEGPSPFARIAFVDAGSQPAQSVMIGAPLVEGVEFRKIEATAP